MQIRACSSQISPCSVVSRTCQVLQGFIARVKLSVGNVFLQLRNFFSFPAILNLAGRNIGPLQLTKVEGLKAKQASHLEKLLRLAQDGQWQHLREHTADPDSGFDWWMFPTDRLSAGYGTVYQLNQGEIAQLKNDAEFMASYRRGVCLIAESWGFDLTQGIVVADRSRFWSNYQVRLGKMLHSLSLFKQDDLRQVLSKLLIETGVAPTLDGWIQKYLLLA